MIVDVERELSAEELGQLLGGCLGDVRKEWGRLAWLQKHIDGKIVHTWMPSNADAEYKDLLRKAATPWLKYARDAKAQGLVVDGFSHNEVWGEAWQANGMDGRQTFSNREVIGLGKSYGLSLPAVDGGVLMRPLSALKTYAKFADPWDEYPEWVLYQSAKTGGAPWNGEWVFIDALRWYRFTGHPGTPQDIEVFEHGLGFCPVVQLSAELTSEGMPESPIAQGIPVWKRIVDYTFTLSMDMRYGAFPQKWMAGGEIAKDAAGNPMINASVDSLLHADGPGGETARFGSFQSASISDVVAGLESAKADLSAVLQIPPHYFMSKVINMSAEGIEAAESAYFRDLAERRESLGEGYELWLRTAAAILGHGDVAQDTSAEIHWMDQRTRSLGQIADAIVKLRTVGAPDELLFALMPGWTKQDVMDASRAAAESRTGVEPQDEARGIGVDDNHFTGVAPTG